ncbi:hypothetical protein RN001_001778 [Aquatica leii]|uniref:Centromere protein X n=1 Tax=Aquatica leii TaxID=1421715 RepID=A0AAN7PGC9_9COLE|nr:hypothetical protein RN001_001778 [Aquatica leii]
MDSGPGTSKSAENSEVIYSKISTEFQNDIIKETLRSRLKDTKTKISEEAIELMKELARVIVVESAIRAAKQASIQHNSIVSLHNVETMLLQLMLDFP